ncbi:MAG: hypothetical protein DSZ23_04015 [Thermodesulfatator sp.]|nr:MAG: hypothetical protein DSZ23_04015 [Thermodesulfatator sp.]
MSLLPTACPPDSSWEIISPDFKPRKIWASQASLVKEAPKRKIIRVSGYFIKAFRIPPGPAGKLRDPARKEWIISRKLAQRDLTPVPVAYARMGRWSYFAARKAEGLELGEYLESHLPFLGRNALKELEYTFVKFLFDIAGCGVVQPDFHLNNCLFNEKNKQFLLLDLHRARLQNAPLGPEEIMDQMVFVLAPFFDKLPRRNILEAASFAALNLPRLKSRKERYSIQKKAFDNMRRHWQKKEKRKLRGTELIERKGPYLVLRHPKTEENIPKDLERLVREPETCLHDNTLVREKIKDSRHTLCLRAVLAGQDVFVKAYRSSGNIKAMSYLFRRPRAVKTWQIARRMSYRHIPVVMPLALIQTRNPWNLIYGAIAFPWINQTASSKKLVQNQLADPKSAHLCLKELAYFIWKMHESGICHGDCKITNFIYFPARENKFLVFDLDGTKIVRKISSRQRLADISCMCRSLEKLVTSREITSQFVKLYTDFHLPWKARYKDILARVRNLVTTKGLSKR